MKANSSLFTVRSLAGEWTHANANAYSKAGHKIRRGVKAGELRIVGTDCSRPSRGIPAIVYAGKDNGRRYLYSRFYCLEANA